MLKVNGKDFAIIEYGGRIGGKTKDGYDVLVRYYFCEDADKEQYIIRHNRILRDGSIVRRDSNLVAHNLYKLYEQEDIDYVLSMYTTDARKLYKSYSVDVVHALNEMGRR